MQHTAIHISIGNVQIDRSIDINIEQKIFILNIAYYET